MTADSTSASLRFPASRRLKLNREFARVRAEGRTFRGELIMLGVLAVEPPAPFRAGFVTSKKIGGAVVRSRTRRRLREILRRHQHAIGAGFWVVIIAHPAAAHASSAALEDEWLRLARRASILRA